MELRQFSMPPQRVNDVFTFEACDGDRKVIVNHATKGEVFRLVEQYIGWDITIVEVTDCGARVVYSS